MRRRRLLQIAALAGFGTAQGLCSGQVFDRETPPDGPDESLDSIPWEVSARVKPHARVAGEGLRVSCVTLSPDGALLAVVGGSVGSTFRMYDAASGRALFTAPEITGGVIALAFSPDGTRIVSASLGGGMMGMTKAPNPFLLRISDARSGKILREIQDQNVSSAKGVSMTSDGTVVVLDFNETLRGWNSADGKEIFRVEGPRDRFQLPGFSPVQAGFSASANGKRAVSLSAESHALGDAPPKQKVSLWDVERGTYRSWKSKLGGVLDLARSVAISPDGGRVLLACPWPQFVLIEFETGREVSNFSYMHTMVNGDGAYHVAFSPDGIYYVVAMKDGFVRMEDGKVGGRHDTIRGPRTYPRSVAFLKDRLRIVSGGFQEAGYRKAPNGRVGWLYEPLWIWDAEFDDVAGQPRRFKHPG